MKKAVCPNCGSHANRNSRSRSLRERLACLAGVFPRRCMKCNARFQVGIWSFTDIRYAKCPRCYSSKLTDWSEPYYYPPKLVRTLLWIGGKAHRCSGCRLNFISFRGRKKVKPASKPLQGLAPPSGGEAPRSAEDQTVKPFASEPSPVSSGSENDLTQAAGQS